MDLISRTLRKFRLTDDNGLSALFLGTELPTANLVALHFRTNAVLLPPSVTPEFLAAQILDAFREATPAPPQESEISCWQIDQFKPYKMVDASGVVLPIIVDEDHIKTCINRLLLEREDASDWPGEHNDIFGRCSVNGHEFTIAIMLKGKSVLKPLRIKDAGKNSDQLIRLADSPANILAVQHVHKITEQVRRQLRMNVEALRARGSETYCTFIDGIDTYRLLSSSV